MINCKIPKTAVIGMTAVLLLCGCAGQKALDAEPSPQLLHRRY